jgi:hypothetical protein
MRKPRTIGCTSHQAINEIALTQGRSLTSHFVRGGEFVDDEYSCSFSPGGTTMIVNSKTGRWRHEAAGRSGADLVSWISYCFSVEMWVAEILVTTFLRLDRLHADSEEICDFPPASIPFSMPETVHGDPDYIDVMFDDKGIRLVFVGWRQSGNGMLEAVVQCVEGVDGPKWELEYCDDPEPYDELESTEGRVSAPPSSAKITIH